MDVRIVIRGATCPSAAARISGSGHGVSSLNHFLSPVYVVGYVSCRVSGMKTWSPIARPSNPRRSIFGARAITSSSGSSGQETNTRALELTSIARVVDHREERVVDYCPRREPLVVEQEVRLAGPARVRR